MDIQHYISSGIIEAYVLGIASEEEIRNVESLSARYPEIAAAIEDCRQTMEDYAGLHHTAPPAGLQEEIWKQLEEEQLTSGTAMPVPVAEQDNTVSFPGQEVKALRKIWLSRSLAASLVLLIASIAFNLVLWNRSRVHDREIAQLRSEQSGLIARSNQSREELLQARQFLQMLTDTAARQIPLAGVGRHTASSAVVVWNSRSKEVYLSLSNMPEPPKGSQYQLWAIVDGKPVDLGISGLNQDDSLQKMKSVQAPEMFAITLEKEGGNPTPTLEQMYVAGKI